MTNEFQVVLKKLDTIQSELHYIKEHMVDVDTLLTPEEEERLEESLKEFREGKTTSFKDFEKEMEKRHV